MRTHRFLWRLARFLADFRPYRPLWVWWRISRSSRVWRWRWLLTSAQYNLRDLTDAEMDERIDAARKAIKEAKRAADKPTETVRTVSAKTKRR